MKNNRVLIAITLVNLGILSFLLLRQTTPVVNASAPASVIRARGLEIVDDQGKVRASIQVLPAGPARKADGSSVNDGKIYPEAVLFRLIRPDGRPTVKISTSEQGSGIALGGAIDLTYIVLSADGGTPSLSLTNKDGRKQLVNS